MNLKDLILDLGITVRSGNVDKNIADLTDDSRCAAAGCLFIARTREHDDGSAFAADAVSRGCDVVLVSRDCPVQLPDNVTVLEADSVDQSFAGKLAQRMYDDPASKLQLIGVTGTNGKTTVAYLIRYLLAHAKIKCGLVGTVEIDDGSTPYPAELTTPGAIELTKLLAKMVDNGCKAAVLEVSSHALHQGRVAFLPFKVGVFTNLTGDHLDYHGTMDAYADAKAILFRSLAPTSWAILNADDMYVSHMAEGCDAHKMWCTFDPTHESDGHTCTAQNITLRADGSYARFTGPWGSVEGRIPLIGRHNVANALQAVAAAAAITPLDRSLRSALLACPAVPGRLQVVPCDTPNAPTVVVDYAHTHDALQNVLLALRPITPGKLSVVFGCGGDRDQTKRPKMAAVACKLADRVYVTSDNPRTEDPNFIISQIMQGIDPAAKQRVTSNVDRTTAIRTAIQDASPDDTVLIAGKGHEDYQIIGTEKIHYDDMEVAGNILSSLLSQTGSTS